MPKFGWVSEGFSSEKSTVSTRIVAKYIVQSQNGKVECSIINILRRLATLQNTLFFRKDLRKPWKILCLCVCAAIWCESSEHWMVSKALILKQGHMTLV